LVVAGLTARFWRRADGWSGQSCGYTLLDRRIAEELRNRRVRAFLSHCQEAVHRSFLNLLTPHAPGPLEHVAAVVVEAPVVGLLQPDRFVTIIPVAAEPGYLLQIIVGVTIGVTRRGSSASRVFPLTLAWKLEAGTLSLGVPEPGLVERLDFLGEDQSAEHRQRNLTIVPSLGYSVIVVDPLGPGSV
jgi:hypothetical protein